MKRREFIKFIGGATATWPFATRAQQTDRARRIGVLMNVAVDDPEAPARVGAFSQGLAELGWTIGRNVRIDYRWYAGNAAAARKYAAELLALAPDVVVASGTLGVTAIQQDTRPVPIVFTLVSDPVGAGVVNSLARPDGNATGFMLYEYSLSGKWLELLKQIAPRTTRAAVIREQANAAGIAQFSAIQALAPSLRVQVSPIRPGGNLTGATSYVAQLASRQLEVLHGLVPTAVTIGVFMNPHARANAEPQVRDLREAAKALGLRLHVIEVGGEGDLATAFATLAGARADALFVTADGFLHNQLRDPIVALAARHQLPAMYVYRDCVEAGGLICYTSSLFDAGRQAGVYAGRILKGAKPADLPVTQPTKFELVINLTTAKALGLTIPDKLLAIADEVIE